jgi:hypothetical protein
VKTRVRDQAQPLAHPCPCCGGPMFVIETFEAGCQPRHPPTAPLVANGIDTIKHCATAPKDRAPSPTSLYLAYASQRAMTGLGQNEPCHSLRRHGRSTSISGPAGPAVGASGWANRQPSSGHTGDRCRFHRRVARDMPKSPGQGQRRCRRRANDPKTDLTHGPCTRSIACRQGEP